MEEHQIYLKKSIAILYALSMVIAICILLTAASCKKETVTPSPTLKMLYNLYKDGEIDEGKYNGNTVYIAGANAYDAPSIVYDTKGNVIGTCNYAWGQVDAICAQIQNMEVIYRCNNHISGQPPIDKYGLGH